MKQESDIRALIEGQTVLGIEMGSTRIKSVLLNASHEILASGSFQWAFGHIAWLMPCEVCRRAIRIWR